MASTLRVTAPGEKAREFLTLLFVGLVPTALAGVGFLWGLPNDDEVWSTDALTPMAPLAVLYRLVRGGWNSGWFYYKYPLGHPLLLCLVYAPYLGWLWATGGLARPAAEYPYGFEDPETSLFVLAVLARSVSAACAVGSALLLYLGLREVLPRKAACAGSLLFGTAMPVVYYAHTTNVDAALLFWCTLCLYGAIRVAARGEDARGLLYFFLGGVMAVSTKEYAYSFFLGAGFSLVFLRWRRGSLRTLPAGTVQAVSTGVGIFLLANAVVWNPLGFWRRLLFLADVLPPELAREYAPRLSHVGSLRWKGWSTEVEQAARIASLFVQGLGAPATLSALLGVVFCTRRFPGGFFAATGMVYYVFSLRSLEMLQLRYVLPLHLAGGCLVACLLTQWLRGRPPARVGATILGTVLVAYGVVRGGETSWLLRTDSRYDAERWLVENVPPSATIEVYQRRTYLPRFSGPWRVRKIPFEELTTEKFLERSPDFVVISSAGKRGIVAKFVDPEDTEKERPRRVARRGSSGEVVAYEYLDNKLFLEALEKGCLGYEVVAEFRRPFIFVPRAIPSLAPRIWIYRRLPGGAARASPCFGEPEQRESP